MYKKKVMKYDKQWYISLTEKCNWTCDYCDFPKKEKQCTVDIDFLKLFLDWCKEITKNHRVGISVEGGELGMLSEEMLDTMFFSNLQEQYTIATNGLFLKRDLLERYHEKIEHIIYHVSQEFNDTTDIDDYDFKNISVHYTMVVHKNNLRYLDKFLLKHPDKIFHPHILQPRTPGLNLLRKDDFIQLSEIIKEKSNVTEAIKQRIDRIISVLDNTQFLKFQRTICSGFYTQPIFDLTNRKIKHCCISISGDEVDLTYDNLQRLMNNDLTLFPNVDVVCDGCIANFLWHDYIFFGNKNKKILANIIKGVNE